MKTTFRNLVRDQSVSICMLQHTCTFEHKTPLSVVQTEDGILVQSDKVTVREKEDQTKMIILDKKVPYLLKTDKPVSVIYQNAEEIYEPILKGTVRQILHSQLTEYQLNTLSKMQILQNLDLQYVYHEHIHIIGLSIIGIVCISVLFICVARRIVYYCIYRESLKKGRMPGEGVKIIERIE